MRVVTNGVFDILTVGHFNLLNYARALAGDNGELHVIIDLDSKVKKDKGNSRPVFPISDRMNALFDLRYGINKTRLVDKVHVFMNNDELWRIIATISPDLLIKGSDWRGKEIIGSDICKVEFFEITPGYSSTNIIEKCQK